MQPIAEPLYRKPASTNFHPKHESGSPDDFIVQTAYRGWTTVEVRTTTGNLPDVPRVL
jgi:hypothetical protein